MAERVLILVSTTSYRTDDFVRAAHRLGVEPIVGNDRCHELAKVWPDEKFGTLPVELRDPARAVEQIVAAARERPFDAVVATDEQTALIAALAAERLGLKGNAPKAAYCARNKLEMRRKLSSAQVAVPRFSDHGIDDDPRQVATKIPYPCVLKPLLLSTSRGVIRADGPGEFVAAWERICALLSTPAMKAVEDPAGRRILVEDFIPGSEVALEGILVEGRLHVLALFDKPDPLDGPYFEESIYLTPSRLAISTQTRIAAETEAAARAMGLITGPVHAELRVGLAGPVVIEVAARSIGGLCSRTLRFGLEGHSLEEVVLAHALGHPIAKPDVRRAAGVMMIPVPSAGVFQEVLHVDRARAVEGIEDIVISVRKGEILTPLPEGASYFGFIFARGDTPGFVEAALRRAHGALEFRVAPRLAHSPRPT